MTPDVQAFKKEAVREPLKQVLRRTYLSRYRTLLSLLVIDHNVNETQ